MKEDLKMISPCGINCEMCAAYKATVSDDLEEKKRLAKEWSTPKCTFKAKEIYCKGCLESEWKMTRACSIRNCCKMRNLTSCAYCEAYPCSRCKQNDNLDVIKNSTQGC